MGDSAKRGHGAARVPRGALGSGLAEEAAEKLRGRGRQIDRVVEQATGGKKKDKKKKKNDN